MTDWHHNQLFYELCKAMGIKILMTIPTRLGYRVIISEEISKLDSEINSTPNDLDINSSDKLQEYLNANNAFKQATRYTKDYRSFNWHKLKKSLQDYGTVQLCSKKTENKALRDALMKTIATHVEIDDFYLLWPIIERTERSDADIKVTITLREKV